MISASKILVTGSRDWFRGDVIARALAEFSQSTIVIHGDCRGADRVADKVAKKLGMTTCPHPANWRAHGRAAGPIRNREMLDLGPDYVLAFHDHLLESRGTKDCVNEALRRKIPVFVFSSDGKVLGMRGGSKPGVTKTEFP